MRTRRLGRTGLDVSVIGLGTEYLFKKSFTGPGGEVRLTISDALDRGVNYIDLVFNMEDFLKEIARGLKGRRESVILTGHLGSGEKNGRYMKIRRRGACLEQFHRTLALLGTDRVDVVNIHYVQDMEEYRLVEQKERLLELAVELKGQGKARFIGMSTHDPGVASAAAASGLVDVIMIQVNPANNAMPGRNRMLAACAASGVGVVGMKIFAGGKLLRKKRNAVISKYQTGGRRLIRNILNPLTPAHCINYALSQVGVCTVVPGVRDRAELEESLSYLSSSKEEMDYSPFMEEFREYVPGECMYCNHCLPCPAGIDIARSLRLLDRAGEARTEEMYKEYASLSRSLDACTGCAECTKRCPFGVKTELKIKECRETFRKA